jgi:IPT/TIG domain-containing protein
MFVRPLNLIGWLVLSACSGNDDVPAPSISGVQPDHGMPGITVMVSGSYLCQQPHADGSDVDPLACAHIGTVTFGTAPGVAVSYTDTVATVEVPALPPGAVDVAVSVAGRNSNRISFLVE